MVEKKKNTTKKKAPSSAPAKKAAKHVAPAAKAAAKAPKAAAKAEAPVAPARTQYAAGMSDPTTLPYGSWPSPITLDIVLGGSRGLAEPKGIPIDLTTDLGFGSFKQSAKTIGRPPPTLKLHPGHVVTLTIAGFSLPPSPEIFGSVRARSSTLRFSSGTS